MRVARVIVDLALDKSFDYLVPPELATAIRPGVRVIVPFGRTRKNGYVLELGARAAGDFKLKAIAALAENPTQLTPGLLELGRWMADYYCCSQEQAIRALLPGAVRHGKIRRRTLTLYSVDALEPAERFIAENSGRKTAIPRVEILKYLLKNREQSLEMLTANVNASAHSVKTLLKAGLISVQSCAVYRPATAHAEVVPDVPKTPTAEQRKALEQITGMLDCERPSPHVCLLFGVTGSGKTEVYLQAIAHALAQGRGAIVLVPEIALTPQTVRRFRARFGEALSVMHSRLTDTERFEQWLKIRNGDVKIVVGARSALFAPLAKIGLIIVDEEHESSYKQSEAPRYSARDVAVMRGKLENAVVLLGSATPSLESYYNAKAGKYLLATLSKRAENQPLPTVRVVDLKAGRAERPADGAEPKSMLFSSELLQAIRERLALKEQTILFLNRRGFARKLRCPDCEGDEPDHWVARCPYCSADYIYHRTRQTLSCYLCGNVAPVPEVCPKCGSPNLRKIGSGTEKGEDLLAKIFPRARIVRMDSDTMRTLDSYELTLDKFRRGDIDILIGTQMIAKGLDFPNVTLVGVLNADMGLFVPDLRAAERTFQLLTQVAGRSGRGSVAGEVIVQTYSPYNDVIRYAVEQNYPGFYEYDLGAREILHYPPFGHLIAVYFRGPDEAAVAAEAGRFFEMTRACCHDRMVLAPPVPAPIARIMGKYRYLMTVRGERLRAVRLMLRKEALHGARAAGVEIQLDVDALNLA